MLIDIFKKYLKHSQVQWHTHVNLATQESETGGSQVQGHLGYIHMCMYMHTF